MLWSGLVLKKYCIGGTCKVTFLPSLSGHNPPQSVLNRIGAYGIRKMHYQYIHATSLQFGLNDIHSPYLSLEISDRVSGENLFLYQSNYH